MAYSPNHIAVFRPTVVNDTPTNGGMTTRTVLADGILNSVFPDITAALREQGAETLRKIIYKPNVMASHGLYDCVPVLTALEGIPPNHRVFLRAAIGTEYDNQQDASTYPYYALHQVAAPQLSGDVLTIPCPVSEPAEIYQGVAIVYSPTAGTTREVVVNSAVRLGSNTEMRITFNSGHGIVGGDCLSFVPKAKGIDGSLSLTPRILDVVTTSPQGIFKEAQVTITPSGAIKDSYTLTFTSQDTYILTGLNSGISITGNRNTSLKVPHPKSIATNDLEIGITIPSAAFEGSWAVGNTVTFKVESGACAVWFKRIISSGVPELMGTINLGLSLAYKTV